MTTIADAEQIAYEAVQQAHHDYCNATQERVVAQRVEAEAKLEYQRARAFYESQYGEDE